MGQDWRLISIDNKLCTYSPGKMGEFFWKKNWTFIAYLIAPVISPSYLEADFPVSSPPDLSKAAPILLLPPEILFLIVKSIHNYVDIICLSLTCLPMWLALSHIRYLSLSNKLRRRSWAGTRIILLGNYAEDLPVGFITSSECDRMDELLGHPTELDEHEGPVEPRDLALLYRATYHYFGQNPRRSRNLFDYDHRQHFFSRFSDCRDFPQRISEKWIWIDDKDFFPKPKSKDDRWMLRNLSKKEFVIKANLKGGVHGLVQALYTLISWSSDTSLSMLISSAHEEAIIRGPWAGDKLDVTLKSAHDEQEHEGWKDITTRVVAVLDSIAESNHCNFKFDDHGDGMHTIDSTQGIFFPRYHVLH